MSAPRRRETVSAAYVLGAGGAHSVTRYSMQQHLDGETYDGRYIVADAKIRLPGRPTAAASSSGRPGSGCSRRCRATGDSSSSIATR
jgi:2-polyprenyl-6-methoxyphenol hydroxylase-like FAD-dependent oxidoreductase